MIAIVIVSHSRKLAEGLKEVADAMSQAPVPIASAGGIDDSENPLGTDALRVLDAIRSVVSSEAVLVFADIGSARLNAEMAIDLLGEDERQKVRFCDAPLVEGVLSAAVQIAAGSRIEAVIQEAQQVCRKSTDDRQPDQPTEGAAREFTIRNSMGLHARPAALFVKAMNAFGGDIRLKNVTKDRSSANAKSINGVMLSEVSANDTIRVSVNSDESTAVFDEIERLVIENFGEVDTAPITPETPNKNEPTNDFVTSELEEGILTGVAVAPGFAVGPLHHVRYDFPDVTTETVADTGAELERIEEALSQAEAEIKSSLDSAGRRISSYDRKIFDAHISFLHDPEFLQQMKTSIVSNRLSAEAAWRKVVTEYAEKYEALDDPLLKARANDLIDVGLRVFRLLQNVALAEPSNESVILAFDELRPSDVLALDANFVLGICTKSGGKTSHAGILASTLPVPVVFSLGDRLEKVAEGRQVLLDGSAASITIEPGGAAIAKMESDRTAWQKLRQQAEAGKFLPAKTMDNYTVRVAANMASVDELGLIASSGAEEIGLLRTEFLFMRREAPPNESEQLGFYRTLVEGLAGKPLTVRTVDIGGDKPVPYMERSPEANPNLGWRGLRYSLEVTELFDTQLAAILRASAFGPVRIMFPLVSTLEEVRMAKLRLAAVMDRLRQIDEPFDEGVQVGIMVEVPAAAEMADLLAPEVDFLSIGTNDLTQYVMASDRANPKVQNLFDPFQPAVLRMIKKSIDAAHKAKIWSGMCGAMAGDPLAAPILIGLGLDEFSMTASDIPAFKLTVRRLDQSKCRDLAADVLQESSAKTVRTLVSDFLGMNDAA